MSSARYRLGIDVGGTFTDVVALEERTGQVFIDKVPSTPRDPAVGVLNGIAAILRDRAIQPEQVGFIAHGTTVATNAFLTKRGARTVLLSTRGFRDVLEFRRMDRSGGIDPYDLFFDFPEPLVPRRRRLEVAERVSVHGEILEPLTDQEIERVLDEVTGHEPAAIAVSLLFSFLNPAHERRLGAALRARFPDCHVSLSHEVDPEIMEYERTSTTVLNAYVGPLVEGYLARLEGRLSELRLPSPMIMQSNGGLVTPRVASERPVTLLESGPAGGVGAAAYFANLVGCRDVVAVDMGGTSFDVALAIAGRPERVVGADVDGYAVRTPMIDIHSIGAGGGSLAWVDAGGVLHVGPQSAGAEPGPACYGRGGDHPTTTDANLVLGYLDPSYFVGGKMALDVDRAHRTVEEHVARPLGMSIQDAAWGIRRIVDANMAAAMRLMLSRRGLDPRDFTLVPYGGAGPIHSAFLGRELGIPTTLVPRFPGTLSAFGLAISDLAHDYTTAVLRAVETLDPAEVQAAFESMERTATATLAEEGMRQEQITLARSAELRYVGQLHELTLPLPGGVIGREELARLLTSFHEQHAALYGFSVPGEPVMLVTLRLAAAGHIERPELPRVPEGEDDASAARKADRRVFLPEWGDLCACPVFERAALRAGNSFSGPAVVEQLDSTVVVLPGQQVKVDAFGSLIVKEVA